MAKPHTLTFTWNAQTRSNSCEAAVRLGAQNGTTTGCTACVYPGSPSRTQTTDGHFVTVTYTSLCGNGILDPGQVCDLGAQNGASTSCCTSSCQYRTAGATCRAAVDVCDSPETCTGTSDTCPTNGFLPAGIECRGVSSGDSCDEAEQSTGTGPGCPFDSVKPNGTICRSAVGECDVTDSCDGSSKQCPADAKAPNGTPCTSDGNVCTLDQCNGTSSLCQHPAGNSGTVCRASAGECDPQEVCNGTSTSCPADAKTPNGTACTDDGNVCTLDQCNGSSALCQHPAGHAGALCRASTGECDPQETCTGTSTTCPADAKRPKNCSACRRPRRSFRRVFCLPPETARVEWRWGSVPAATQRQSPFPAALQWSGA